MFLQITQKTLRYFGVRHKKDGFMKNQLVNSAKNLSLAVSAHVRKPSSALP